MRFDNTAIMCVITKLLLIVCMCNVMFQFSRFCILLQIPLSQYCAVIVAGTHDLLLPCLSKTEYSVWTNVSRDPSERVAFIRMNQQKLIKLVISFLTQNYLCLFTPLQVQHVRAVV